MCRLDRLELGVATWMSPAHRRRRAAQLLVGWVRRVYRTGREREGIPHPCTNFFSSACLLCGRPVKNMGHFCPECGQRLPVRCYSCAYWQPVEEFAVVCWHRLNRKLCRECREDAWRCESCAGLWGSEEEANVCCAAPCSVCRVRVNREALQGGVCAGCLSEDAGCAGLVRKLVQRRVPRKKSRAPRVHPLPPVEPGMARGAESDYRIAEIIRRLGVLRPSYQPDGRLPVFLYGVRDPSADVQVCGCPAHRWAYFFVANGWAVRQSAPHGCTGIGVGRRVRTDSARLAQLVTTMRSLFGSEDG